MRVLVIGGAGFIGATVAARYLARGHHVVVLDNLSRRGARENLLWLEREHGRGLHVVLGDAVADRSKLDRLVAGADAVYHFAGQVAVTTSLVDPGLDLRQNLLSTVNVLESMRELGSRAPFVFASTNKVYGALDGIASRLVGDRWDYADGRQGIGEREPLDFHSPYGCSKGAADQYVRDYARVYGLSTVVFRQSCIYGPRQFGVTDQGWLVHFILAFARKRPIVIYGDGRQVRDALYVDDLVDAFEAAVARGDELRGEVFNIGGGTANRLSILDLVGRLERLFGASVEVSFAPWRQGDQRVFVSDNAHVCETLGWQPRVGLDEGLERTIDFVQRHLHLFEQAIGRG